MGNRRETKSTHKRKKVDGRKRILTTAIVTLVAIVAVFGVYELGRHNNYWGEPDELRAIKAESIANKDLLGLRLVSSSQKGQGELLHLKTPTPSVINTFDTQPGETNAVLKQVRELAEQDGWIHDPTVHENTTKKTLWRKQGKVSPRMTLVIETAGSTISIEVSGYGSYEVL